MTIYRHSLIVICCVSELQPPTGLLFIPQMISVYGGPRWNDNDRGKLKNSEKNLPQYHFVHLTYHTDWPGSEPGPLWWEVGDWPPEPWHGLIITRSAVSSRMIVNNISGTWRKSRKSQWASVSPGRGLNSGPLNKDQECYRRYVISVTDGTSRHTDSVTGEPMCGKYSEKQGRLYQSWIIF
jgi:hypothetical protein